MREPSYILEEFKTHYLIYIPERDREAFLYIDKEDWDKHSHLDIRSTISGRRLRIIYYEDGKEKSFRSLLSKEKFTLKDKGNISHIDLRKTNRIYPESDKDKKGKPINGYKIHKINNKYYGEYTIDNRVKRTIGFLTRDEAVLELKSIFSGNRPKRIRQTPTTNNSGRII